MRLRERVRRGARRLEVARELQRQVVLGLVEPGVHRLVNPGQLVEELLRRLRRLVGLHARGGVERSGASRISSDEAPRVAVDLAEIVVQARRERLARIVLSTRRTK